MSDDALNNAIERMLTIDRTIKKLDPAIRAAAFEILSRESFGETGSGRRHKEHRENNDDVEEINTEGRDAFYSSHDHKMPKDNVLLIVAWLYSQYGKCAISKSDINREADDAGITVPSRPDMTMRQNTQKGKKLFKSVAGGFELTVHGEGFIKNTYKVIKGKKKRPSEDDVE